MGFRRRRETEQRRSDAGIISWDSTSGWVSGLSGPYREAHALRSFAGGTSARHTVDGELCDVAWCFGQRALFCGAQREVLRSWKDRSRSDPRLSSSQRVNTGRSRALAGSVSKLSTFERGRYQVTHSRYPSAPESGLPSGIRKSASILTGCDQKFLRDGSKKRFAANRGWQFDHDREIRA